MNDEIKEIINDLQRVADRKCYPEDILDGSIAQEWVDYITDLQEENKELEEDKSKMFETAVKRNNQLLDRIDKAIEYIKSLQTCHILNSKKIELLDILQGSDNK
jgi:hypothetical protein